MNTSDLVKGPTILLNSGGYFSFTDIDQMNPTIEDIARGLANTCRYAGQPTKFYSVAEHSVIMSHFVAKHHAYAALMHDSAEAMIVDMPKPLKEILPQYQEVEQRVEAQLSIKFGIPFPLPKEVKTADVQMLLLEKEHLFGNTDAWSWCAGLEKPEGVKIENWLPDEGYDRFLFRYHQIKHWARAS